MVDRFTDALFRVTGTLKVRSAANPALWFFAVSLAGYVAILCAGREPPVVLSAAVVVSLIVVVFVIVRFTVADPDRLQSEEFQINQQTLRMIADKGTRQQKADVAKVWLQAKPYPNLEEQK